MSTVIVKQGKVSQAELSGLISEFQHNILDSDLDVSLLYPIDPNLLLIFIRTKDYNLHAAFGAFQKYSINIHKELSFYKGMRPSMLSVALNSNVLVPLKAYHSSGAKMFIIKPGNWSPMKFNAKHLELSSLLIYLHYLKDEVQIQENGVVYIYDGKGVRLEHLRAFGFTEARNLIKRVQNGIPMRIAGTHYVNLPAFISPLIRMTRLLLTEKVRNRTQVHSNLESLHKCVKKVLLPQSLGGDLSEADAVDKQGIAKILEYDIPLETQLGIQECSLQTTGKNECKTIL